MGVSLTELERLEKAATPGPWHAGRRHMRRCPEAVRGMGDCLPGNVFATFMDQDDCSMVEAARNALPALLRIARAARAYWGSTDEDRVEEQDELDEALKAVGE